MIQDPKPNVEWVMGTVKALLDGLEADNQRLKSELALERLARETEKLGLNYDNGPYIGYIEHPLPKLRKRLLQEAYGQLKHLVDDLVTVENDDGYVTYTPKSNLMFSNLIGAVIRLLEEIEEALHEPTDVGTGGERPA